MSESVFMDNVVNRFLEVFFEEAWPSWARYLRRTGNSDGHEEDGVVDKRKLKKADSGFAIKSIDESRPFLLVEAKRPAVSHQSKLLVADLIKMASALKTVTGNTTGFTKPVGIHVEGHFWTFYVMNKVSPNAFWMKELASFYLPDSEGDYRRLLPMCEAMKTFYVSIY